MIYSSHVFSGKGRGRKIGFPTFNLAIPENFDEKYGVYSAKLSINKKTYLGALFFGPIPTFDEKNLVLEIFVLDYVDKEPVEEINFELTSYIREPRRFSGEEELKRQIAEDVAAIKKQS